MEKLTLQRELEDQLRKLRIELKLHEKKVKSVVERTNKDERRATKRQREDKTTDSNKRLRSAVSVVTKGDTDQTKTKAEDDDVPIVNMKKENTEEEDRNHIDEVKSTEGEQQKLVDGKTDIKSRITTRRNASDKQRDRRLFSSLLQGTLNSFKRSTNDETELKTIQKRKEVEMQIEQRVATEQQQLLELEKQKLQEEKRLCEEKVSKVKEDIKLKETQLSNLKFSQHQQLLSVFLKTNAMPAIYFYPSKTDEFTERVLGTKKPIEPLKDTVTTTEEVPTAEEPLDGGGGGDDDGGGGGGDDDVEVQEITREKEAVLPIITQQDEEDMDDTTNTRTEDYSKTIKN